MTNPNTDPLDAIMEAFETIPEPEAAPATLRCSKCCLPKPLEAFRRDPSTARGYSYDCRTCLREQYKRAHPPKGPHSSNPHVMGYIDRINEKGIAIAEAQIETAARLLRAYRKALKLVKTHPAKE